MYKVAAVLVGILLLVTASTAQTIRAEKKLAAPITDPVTNERYSAEADVCGPWVTTAKLNEARADQRTGPNGEKCRANEKYCFFQYHLTVTVPSPITWTFTGDPRVECKLTDDLGPSDTQTGGSCAWNAPGASGRYEIVSNNPDKREATQWMSSRSVQIRLCSLARTILK